MSKVSMSNISNDYCPQTLFCYGTYRDDGQPNFGLFCWFSYGWMDQLCVMACIGENKLTLDRILEKKVFSANLVNEKMLPLADYFGTTSGHDPEKMSVDFAWEKGQALEVPVLSDSPVTFELEAQQIIPLNEAGSTLLMCKIHNVLIDPMLADENLSLQEKMNRIAPVSTTCETYFGWQGGIMGGWGEPGKVIKG